VDSISALCRAPPTEPMEPAIPASSGAWVNGSDVYCEPASEGCTRPVAVEAALRRGRVNSACSIAELTRGLATEQGCCTVSCAV
jgi:hypothetical protein